MFSCAKLVGGGESWQPKTGDGGEEYEYDSNGNMVLDRNKNLRVTYNMLNLPELAEFGDYGAAIQWIYLADGTKLRKNLYDRYGDYAGGIDYNGAVVYDISSTYVFGSGYPVTFAYAPHPEGRVLRSGGEFKYVFNICDHLGNVRVSFSRSASNGAQLEQADDYYPFGMRLPKHSRQEGEENPYLYNGKEWEDDHGLNWYHYGARYYDPQLGRWHSVDPADEFYSPYVYCHNDPVNFLDPDGSMESESEVSLEEVYGDTMVLFGLPDNLLTRILVPLLLPYTEAQPEKIDQTLEAMTDDKYGSITLREGRTRQEDNNFIAKNLGEGTIQLTAAFVNIASPGSVAGKAQDVVTFGITAFQSRNLTGMPYNFGAKEGKSFTVHNNFASSHIGAPSKESHFRQSLPPQQQYRPMGPSGQIQGNGMELQRW